MEKYAYEIRNVMEKIEAMTEEERNEALENLLVNVVKYAVSGNRSKENWIAHELLSDVIDEKSIAEIFDE